MSNSQLQKSIFICSSCGSILKKWSGQCPDCGEWNTVNEEKEEGGLITHNQEIGKVNKLEGKLLSFETLDKDIKEFPRLIIGCMNAAASDSNTLGELDRVLGGGLVKGSAVLIGGDPGIGKSTLLLQTICSLANNGVSCLYISGEESTNQVRLRADRLGLKKSPIRIASAVNVSDMLKTLQKEQPQIVVIDSIQTVYTPDISASPGSVSQVRTCANELISLAKTKNITMLIVSHVNKDGQIAGPKVLEHMVDTVLYFEGDKDYQYRIIRSIKNRFGAANEIGVFDMGDGGLIEINNPSELFLSSRQDLISGSAVFGGIEGTRALFAEVQSLLTPSFIPIPRRSCVGYSLERLNMLIAVLTTRYGLKLYDKEVYLNIVGGLKISEPAADLATALSLISAYKDKPLPKDVMAVGEIGLSGEVRPVPQIEARLKEAEKLGFKKAIIPYNDNYKFNVGSNTKQGKYKIKITMIKHIRDVAECIASGISE
ncbi:MAG: DNA repair protein RadA [Rickettsiales bacterium]|jgi:DNA repair protein RadA/Sms|nr:DNA repair protein RadA [Rickettsiales bacterium]